MEIKDFSFDKENDSFNMLKKLDDITKTNINNNNIFELPSFPNSFPEYIFKNVDQKELDNMKCIYCDLIPLFPKVTTSSIPSNLELKKNKNKKIICNDCYSRLKNNNDISLKGKTIDQKSSNYFKQIIHNYDIVCINNDCEWKGKLSKLQTHLKTECENQKIKCPNKGCKDIFIKKDLNNHLINCFFYENSLIIKCKYCGKEVKKNNIDEHLSVCPEIIVDCDNNCENKIKRKDLDKHNMVCSEYNLKCKYWKYGCKNMIKRKLMKNHELKDIYNHYNLVKHYYKNIINKNDEHYNVLKIINNIKKEIEEKEKNEKENKEKIQLKEEKELDPISFEWNQKIKNQNEKRKIENKIYYNDYIPFIEEPFKFITYKDNIDKKIIFFKNYKIFYLGNSFGNLEKDKYYFVLEKNNLNLNENNNFSFRINKDPSNSSSRLPWVAFGLCVENDNFFNKINCFPKEGFYCVDLQSNTYYNGEINYSEKNDEKLNIDTFITISYLPHNKYLIIKDNDNFEITFPNIPNDNLNLKFFFIFKGNSGAIINYNY